jgi:hypothetical protein
MTLQTTARSSNPGLSGKKTWTMPSVQILDLNAALGASPGLKCDAKGSLSHGSGCS